MAKKKRKHFIKLNNKIRTLFHKPFDEAVEGFSDDLLLGLAMHLEEQKRSKELTSLDRKDIIKYLRRNWSEGDFNIRREIVNFLEDTIAKSKKEKRDKVDFILSFLEDIETTPQEDETILAEFMDKKYSKITEEKIIAKLLYIRMNLFLGEIEEELNISFIGDDSFEFNAKHRFTFKEKSVEVNITHIKKIDISIKELMEFEVERAREYIESLKKSAIEEKKEEVKLFNQDVTSLPYFKDSELIEIFEAISEPIKNLYHSPIPFEYVKSIYSSIDSELEISFNRNRFTFSKRFEAKIFNDTIDYYITMKYDKSVIFSSIWTDDINMIYSDIFEINKRELSLFKSILEELKEKMIETAQPLEFEESEIESNIVRHIKPLVHNSKTLNLKNKTFKKVLFLFGEEIKPLKEKQKREELLAKAIRDFKQLFPVARSLNREIIFHMGPTNSGKTYQALKELKSATTGLYLAPLRLLALEGYEELKASGVNVSLITGEEEIIDEDSTHISSTIEMLNSDIEVDVCVIDEIQMISDRDRGWAWANALIGAPAKKVILTGSQNALEVVKEIANYLNEPLKVVEFKRKNPLILLERPTSIKSLQSGTAIVTFSRKDVLAIKNKISSEHSVSVIYGNLSPEVRREEARRFREGESNILVATDAISMGLNLPIKTILFARDNKFDGVGRRELTTSEVLQIAGRAGRYGIYESGFVGALDFPTLISIKDKFNRKLPNLTLPVSVMASLEHVLLISEILQTQNLYEILEFFSNNMEFEGPFIASNIESMQEIAKIVDEYNLDLVSKYHLSCAPVSLSSPYLEKIFHNILKLLEEGKTVPFRKLDKLPKKALTYTSLLNAEDRVKEVSLYLWLSFKFGDKFLDVEEAKEARYRLNEFIERSLKESNFVKYCKKCGRELEINTRFTVCDECYHKSRQRVNRHRNKHSRRPRR
jgi:ATP-dependent RNA helicase SUPV3L1/SUV3